MLRLGLEIETQTRSVPRIGFSINLFSDRIFLLLWVLKFYLEKFVVLVNYKNVANHHPAGLKYYFGKFSGLQKFHASLTSA